MTRIHSVLTFLILSLACSAQKAKQAMQLDSIFSLMQAQNQFSGTVLIAEKDSIVFEKAYGYSNEASRKPNDIGTSYELASCTKQFTAAAIVLLKRQGKLRYDDKLSKYLPELGFWKEVTIYNLLRHTSGLPYFMEDMAEHWNKTKIATNNDVINYYAAHKDTLLFRPGSRHAYNNTNYVLLASIIERTSGMSYAAFLSQSIFEPLHMERTVVYNRRRQPIPRQNHAIGYVWAKGSFAKVAPEHPQYNDSSVYFLDGVVGHAKISSTAGDLYKWVNALKHNTLLTRAEFEEMTAITNTTGGKPIPYGFGLDVSKGENKFSFGHTGSWDGYVSFIYHNVVKNRTVIILENFGLGTYPFENMMQILNSQPLKPTYRKRIMLPDTAVEKYAGTYTDDENKEEHIITCRDGHLFYNSKNIKWDMRFFPVSDTEFQAIRQGGADGVLKFTVTANGETHLEMLQYGNLVGQGIRKKGE